MIHNNGNHPKPAPSMVETRVASPVPTSAEPPNLPAPASNSPIMRMLEVAVQGGNLEMASKLMDLYDRAEDKIARREFDAAIAAAKAELKPIIRNRESHGGRKYADMAAIAEHVDPIITAHGLSYRFETTQTEKLIQ